MEDLKKCIAKNIQSLRKETGLTQSQLAERLNYSDKAVSKWERGDSVPDIAVLKQIADMFGVTVDYLLNEEHDLPELSQATKKLIRKNRFIITLLATALVWFVATAAFVILGLLPHPIKMTWMCFVIAIPVSCIVMLVFNTIWGRHKFNYLIISVLIWSTLFTLFMSLQIKNVYLLFILGIPSQLIVVLWSKLELGKKIKKNK